MKQGFRQSASWLHTWSGLVLGWLLFAIFLTGTLSFFREEITYWMQPELHASVPSARSADLALSRLAQLAPDAESWTVSLPNDRTDVMQIMWREPGAGQGRSARGVHREVLDAGTGEVLTPRDTAGGDFLYRFHFELYALPRGWARWIVGIATMAMFVAIITGVITHKKIFTDFFTFRPAKGQRSWLDGHNALAVLSLPFHIMITYSGLLLLAGTLMPWATMHIEGGLRGGPPAAAHGQARPEGGRAAAAEARDHDDEEPGERGGRRRGSMAAPRTGDLAPLGPMLASAAEEWGMPAGRFTLTGPATATPIIEFAPRYNLSLLEGGGGGTTRMRFDAATGQRLQGEPAAEKSAPRAVYAVMNSLHRGRFADPGLRWLYYVAGVAGTMMVATGLVLWSVKRAEKSRAERLPLGHRLVDHLNVGSVAGLCIAVAAYFWANRLLPVDLAERPEWEIACFFAVWALTFLHPLMRPVKRAWIEQLVAAGLLLAAIPLLNAATTDSHLAAALPAGNWKVAGFDLTALLTGAAMLYAALKVQRHKGRARAAHPRPAAVPAPAPAAAE